jgi:hypothetical protein
MKTQREQKKRGKENRERNESENIDRKMKTQIEKKKRGKENRERNERQAEMERERGSCLPNPIVRRNCILPAQHSTIFTAVYKYAPATVETV